MSLGRTKRDFSVKTKINKSDLINFDAKNENCPLKHDVAVKKPGGLFLAPSGAKIEVPPGASTGRRERILCASVPSTARGILSPWLGPNLRMASDMHILFSPVNFKTQVAIFIPFSFAATREISHSYTTETTTKEKLRSESKFVKDIYDSDSGRGPDGTKPFNLKSLPKKDKLKTPYTMHFNTNPSKVPQMIDTRSVFLLQCRLGDERWELVEKFTVIQPTIHFTQWPAEARNLMMQSSRWSEKNYLDISSDSNTSIKRISQTNSTRNRKSQIHSQKDIEPIEFIRKIENYCGGVFVATDELSHWFLLVVGSKAEQFVINRDGGLLLSPIIHPFLSIRIPKRACFSTQRAVFKVVELRSNWMHAAYQFDPQLSEVEGCSDIYELDLPDIVLKRPATVRLPLPNWYVEKNSKTHDSWEQTSGTGNSEVAIEVVSTTRTALSESTFSQDKNIIILYQSPGYKRQIVWQAANLEEQKDEGARRKSRIQFNRKDNINTPRCRIDNVYARVGWPSLTVGVKGGQWQVLKQPVYYTQRTAFFDTSVLGRFVMIGARDPERTTASKLAHLMTRIEAMAWAPPGAILVCLQVTPNNWRISASMYPEEKLADAIQDHVAAGFIPLIQLNSSLTRKASGLNNAVFQSLEASQFGKDSIEKMGKERRYRINGHDINHALMFNGLCLELRFTGDIQIKPVSQFDVYTNYLKSKENASKAAGEEQSNEQDLNLDSTVNWLDDKKEKKRDLQKLLTRHARLQAHELMSDTTCTVEIEPKSLNDYMSRAASKSKLITDILKKLALKSTQDDDDDDDDADDDDDNEDEDNDGDEDDDSDKRGGTNKAHQYEGDEDEMDDYNMEIRAQALRNQTLSTNVINEDLSRRLTNIIEKNKAYRATEFLSKIHDLFHMGTVEIWLISPDNLPQIYTAPVPEKEVGNNKVSGVNSQGVPNETGSPTVQKENSMPNASDVETDEHLDNEQTQETHNAVRWNPVGAMGVTEQGRSGMGGFSSGYSLGPKKPLASYNVLIDPDLVVNYTRVITTKTRRNMTSDNVADVSGRPGRANLGSSKARQATMQQRNVSATAKKNQRPFSSDSVWSDQSIVLNKNHTENNEIITRELNLLTSKVIKQISRLVHEPYHLAVALGQPTEELNRIKTLIQLNSQKHLKQIAYDVIKTWKQSYLANKQPTLKSPSDNGRCEEGDTSHDRYSSRSCLDDLIDALQSLGYFEAVEIIIKIKEYKPPNYSC